MGHHLAIRAAAEGAKVVLAARNGNYLDQIAAEIADAGGEVLAVPTDVVEAEACERLVDAAVERFGRIDGLVNNAYRGPFLQRFMDVDMAQWREIYELNVFGALQLTQFVARRMIDQSESGTSADADASIVMVASMAARTGMEGQGGYSGSKGALLAEVRLLATELGSHGIRVNAIVPGWMWGPGVQIYCEYTAQTRGVPVQEVVAEIESRIPLARIPTDEECAGAALFFLSPLASAVTGQALDVNGGEYYA